MTDLRTAAQQALEFICWSQFDPSQSGNLPEPPSTAPQVEASLRAALEQPEQEPVAKSTWQKLYEAAIDQRNEAVALNQELLEALKECLPYVGQTLANTGSMDAYYTEAKACAAINAAERNT